MKPAQHLMNKFMKFIIRTYWTIFS